jgi:hypothetical protein
MMATRRFAFEPGGPERLQITWKFGFRDTRVTLDGKEILRVPYAAAFGGGAEFTFGDGAILRLAPANKFWPDIEAFLDGRKLQPL